MEDDEYYTIDGYHFHNGCWMAVIMERGTDGNFCDVWGEEKEQCVINAEFTVNALNIAANLTH